MQGVYENSNWILEFIIIVISYSSSSGSGIIINFMCM